MGLKPWMTSQDLINAVKRKIAVPLNQRTFSEEDILAFGNEEILISQVPDIMTYHEEYFVVSVDVPLVDGQVSYPIPERAMGAKLRDLYYKDNNDNLFEMTRINPDDKSYWQRESGTVNIIYKYFLEGNNVILAPINVTNPTGSLRFSYFLRPNQLVLNADAAISESFYKWLTIDNTNLVAGDTIQIGDLVFTAVAGSPADLEFQIGATSIISATNLVTAINLDNTYSADNGSTPTAVVNVFYIASDTEFTSSSTGIVVSSRIGLRFNDDLPSHFAAGALIDFLQTKPGHSTLAMDVELTTGSVDTDTITFADGVIPDDFVIGDYVALQYECIIPQIPTDLHSGLAERICSRILAAQGDMQGLQISSAKLGDIKKSEGILLENRVDGSTPKVNLRKSLASYQRMGVRRRI